MSGTNGQITISASGGAGGTITVKSGSNTYSSTDTIDFSKLGLIQDLGSGDLAITGTIGDAEEGTYTDGLFSTFASNTPIGTAIDKINEVLKYLAPNEAPSLDNINVANTGVATYLTFGTTNDLSSASPFPYATVASSAGIASGTNENGLYTVVTASNNIRLGTFAGGITIAGGLNSDVAIAKYSPSGYINYVSGAFGSAEQGSLKLEVNGTNIVTVDLTLKTAGIGQPGTGSKSHTGGAGSGFINLSQTGSAVQSDGNSFGLFQNRTGLFRVLPGDQRNGWNYARVGYRCLWQCLICSR